MQLSGEILVQKNRSKRLVVNDSLLDPIEIVLGYTLYVWFKYHSRGPEASRGHGLKFSCNLGW